MDQPLEARELAAYLVRVGLPDSASADAEGLNQLHHAQFFSIPFENLDILLGRGVSCSAADVFRKLVLNRRGGYCFELNGLMLRALVTMGFEARALLARVHLTGTPSGLTHQLNLVRVEDENWVFDVGFGAGGPRVPLRLAQGTTVSDAASYQLERVEPWGWMLRTLESGVWKDSYSFDLRHVTAADIEVGNHYTSTSPNCHFTQFCTASLPTADGRISLRGRVLTETKSSGKLCRTVEPGEARDLLREVFGIDLPAVPPLD